MSDANKSMSPAPRNPAPGQAPAPIGAHSSQHAAILATYGYQDSPEARNQLASVDLKAIGKTRAKLAHCATLVRAAVVLDGAIEPQSAQDWELAVLATYRRVYGG